MMCYPALKGRKLSAQGVEAQLRSPATLTDKCAHVLMCSCVDVYRAWERIVWLRSLHFPKCDNVLMC